MKNRKDRRFGLAFFIAFLAHLTALFVLMPLYALWHAIKVAFEPGNERLRLGVILAVLLHLAILGPAIHWLLDAEDTSESSGRLELSLFDATPPGPVEPEKTPEEELEEYEPEEELPEGEVARAPKILEEDAPDTKPRFLSEDTSRVKKETRTAVRTPGQAASSAPPVQPSTGSDSQTIEGGMATNMPGLTEELSNLEESAEGEAAARLRAPPSQMNINLNPSLNAMAAAIAGSGLDHLEDVVDADRTALNTAGWKYASFFNRLKAKVEQFWHPGHKYMAHDPYGNVYGFKTRETVLLVVLRSDGSLRKLYVMTSSGAGFLDDEALDAVRFAAPFPNVPDGLKSKRDGLVKFTFHFIVEVGSKPVFRMRRYDR